MTITMEIKENIPLSAYTNFQLGGPARYWVEVKTIDELSEAIGLAKKNSWPILVLAGGTNLIISDQGFKGLVIKISIGSYRFEGELLISGPAVLMAELVDASISHGLKGLEWAGGLPGELGGAIRGNAGAFGGEIKDSIEVVTSIGMTTDKKIIRSNVDCQFGYRDSLFKRIEEVIVEARIRLTVGDEKELRQIADEHIAYRNERHPLEYPNAGSVFKNISLDKVSAAVAVEFKDVIKLDPFPVIPTAAVIARANLKGLKVGQAALSDKHTNYIVNLGQARAEDVVCLIKLIKEKIGQKYGLELEVEPELVGFDEKSL